MPPETAVARGGQSPGAKPGVHGKGQLLHASCVAIDDHGVLLMGPSGAGKSDLAIRLIDRGAELVADDQVLVVRHGSRLIGHAPETIGGLIESRGIGLLRLPFRQVCELTLAVRLDTPSERLPARQTLDLLGVPLPLVLIDPRLPSAVATIRLMLQAERVA